MQYNPSVHTEPLLYIGIYGVACLFKIRQRDAFLQINSFVHLAVVIPTLNQKIHI